MEFPAFLSRIGRWALYRVDPYYLVHKAKELQYHTKMINSGRYVNDSMGRYIGKKVVKRLSRRGKYPRSACVGDGYDF